jgi:hypothetical protein
VLYPRHRRSLHLGKRRRRLMSWMTHVLPNHHPHPPLSSATLHLNDPSEGRAPPYAYVWLECRGRLHVEHGNGRKAIILSGRVPSARRRVFEDQTGPLPARQDALRLFRSVNLARLCPPPQSQYRGRNCRKHSSISPRWCERTRTKSPQTIVALRGWSNHLNSEPMTPRNVQGLSCR